MVAADSSGRRSASAGPEAPMLPGPDRPPLAAIAMLSAAALGYEILVMRLFSIIQWHHFAAIKQRQPEFGAQPRQRLQVHRLHRDVQLHDHAGPEAQGRGLRPAADPV